MAVRNAPPFRPPRPPARATRPEPGDRRASARPVKPASQPASQPPEQSQPPARSSKASRHGHTVARSSRRQRIKHRASGQASCASTVKPCGPAVQPSRAKRASVQPVAVASGPAGRGHIGGQVARVKAPAGRRLQARSGQRSSRQQARSRSQGGAFHTRGQPSKPASKPAPHLRASHTNTRPRLLTSAGHAINQPHKHAASSPFQRTANTSKSQRR